MIHFTYEDDEFAIYEGRARVYDGWGGAPDEYQIEVDDLEVSLDGKAWHPPHYFDLDEDLLVEIAKDAYATEI